eukprot:CAMPEP_0173414114 /NCGR_PEP_ID=MMETSP1356-20130122/83661_1 /TAXON_ID=77927 ORGANISM="Hemiselmis virescens, Strain PCC157" /NCGR_SAMPLE_ID=MMETSP1356 /ASSEMBLY_ACC=CAM_ASM_000847 /LENGTH=207 /DNA_ID=CAMNT_0014376235 /DNA_START=32 /DNA_END=651 /DNA_ORIENTATION=+
MTTPEALALSNEANALFVDEDYDGALDLYTQAIAAAPQSADLLVARAAVYLKLDDFPSAIGDANKAIQLQPSNAKALLRKGIACFSMEEYATAKTAFEKGRELDPNNNQFKTWLRKCNAELEDEMVGDEPPPPAAAPPATSPLLAGSQPKPTPTPYPRGFQPWLKVNMPSHVTCSLLVPSERRLVVCGSSGEFVIIDTLTGTPILAT